MVIHHLQAAPFALGEGNTGGEHMARDMRASIACACDADEAAVVANIVDYNGDPLTPMRELHTIEDCLRWYEQSPKEEPNGPRS